MYQEVYQELKRKDGKCTFKELISWWKDGHLSTEAEPETRVWSQMVYLEEAWDSGEGEG